jgi:hypothetical protein
MLYLSQSILEGLRILGFDKASIKSVSRERNLEEIFLSTLFLNYFIVLFLYILSLTIGSFSIEGRALNMNVVYAFLMIYPFLFNLIVYVLYGFFGFIAEIIDSKNRIKPLISVGFHTAIVYSIIMYVFALIGFFDIYLGLFLFSAFMLYFLYIMFLSLSVIYDFSFEQSLIVLFFPFFILFLAIFTVSLIFPNIDVILVNFFFS